MKYIKLTRLFFAVFFCGIILSSCDKVEVPAPIGDGGQKIIGFLQYGGLSNFGNSSLSFDNSKPIDSIPVSLEFSGPKVFDKDVTVTIGLDNAALTAYNATVPAGGIRYTLITNAQFNLRTTTTTIKAGNTVSEPIYLIFYPDQIDLATSYMIPLSVTNITGASSDVKKASGTGTAYLHIIGNPLAGSYNVDGYFYHPATPRAFTRTGASGFLTPVSDKSLVTELGDLGSSGYYAVLSVDDPYSTSIQHVTISDYPGSISPIVQFDSGLPSSNPGYTPGWSSSGLCNNTYDPATKTFYLRYGYLGGTGYRVTEEVIKKN
ncbi:DUF1735 domain-containing protein [Ferruginibacter profundus]